MKKSILNIGEAIKKAEQKEIFGGFHEDDVAPCTSSSGTTCDPNAAQFLGNPECPIGEICVGSGLITFGGNDNNWDWIGGYTQGTCVCPDA